jgi:hypothetical protein
MASPLTETVRSMAVPSTDATYQLASSLMERPSGCKGFAWPIYLIRDRERLSLLCWHAVSSSIFSQYEISASSRPASEVKYGTEVVWADPRRAYATQQTLLDGEYRTRCAPRMSDMPTLQRGEQIHIGA